MRTTNTDQVRSTDRQAAGSQPDNSTPTGTQTGVPLSTTVALAKLTGGGANGSLTIVNGVVTAYVAPT